MAAEKIQTNIESALMIGLGDVIKSVDSNSQITISGLKGQLEKVLNVDDTKIKSSIMANAAYCMISRYYNEILTTIANNNENRSGNQTGMLSSLNEIEEMYLNERGYNSQDWKDYKLKFEKP